MKISSKKVLVGDLLRISDPIVGEIDPWSILVLVTSEYVLQKEAPLKDVQGFSFLIMETYKRIRYSKRDLDNLVVELVARPDKNTA